MARPKKKKIFDEKRITESLKIDFLYWQYARRKFYRDCKEKIIDVSEFERHYFKVFRDVVQRYCNDYVRINGVIINKNMALSDDNIYYLYGSAPDFIFNRLNEIISVYHNSVNDNPKFAFSFIQEDYVLPFKIERNLEPYNEFMKDVIDNNKDSLEYLRSVCLNYGYYPRELRSMGDIVADYGKLVRNEMSIPETFLRIEEDISIVRANFVSESGKCYFEDNKSGFMYVYCKACADINIDRVIHDFNIAISRKGKRNFSNEIRYSDEPNIQISIDINKYNLKDKRRNLFDEIRYTLLSAINYYVPFKYSFSKEIQDVHWRILHAKYKKISYLRRFMGLFIWDLVHFEGMGLSDIISTLIKIINKHSLNPSDKQKIPRNLIESFREMASFHPEVQDTSKVDASCLDREYRLADQSIQDLSICQHKAGNVKLPPPR